MKGQEKTAFYLIIDHRIRDHIIKCTEEEAFGVSGTKLGGVSDYRGGS